MYYLPQPMICPRCGYEGRHSQHETPAPITTNGLVCPQCYAAMLERECGLLVPLRNEGGGHAT
jgi:hypothetical protein